jgi:hypothetical protein
MFEKIILKFHWADNSFIKSFLKILYGNIIKVNRFIIYELDITKDFFLPPLDEHFTIKVIQSHNLKKYMPKAKNLSREFNIHRIYGIEHCVIVLKNNEICHISWIFMHGDRNRWFELQKDEASLNYSFTFPEFRGRNLFPHAILASARWLRDRGVTRLLEAPHEGTIFTIKSFNKIANFRQVGILSQWFIYRPRFKRLR